MGGARATAAENGEFAASAAPATVADVVDVTVVLAATETGPAEIGGRGTAARGWPGSRTPARPTKSCGWLTPPARRAATSAAAPRNRVSAPVGGVVAATGPPACAASMPWMWACSAARKWGGMAARPDSCPSLAVRRRRQYAAATSAASAPPPSARRRAAPSSAGDHGSATGSRRSTVAARPRPTATRNAGAASATSVTAVVVPKRSASTNAWTPTPVTSASIARRWCWRTSRDTPETYTVSRVSVGGGRGRRRESSAAAAAARMSASTEPLATHADGPTRDARATPPATPPAAAREARAPPPLRRPPRNTAPSHPPRAPPSPPSLSAAAAAAPSLSPRSVEIFPCSRPSGR